MRLTGIVWVVAALSVAAAHGAEFGGFAAHLDYGAGDGPYEIVVADFDGDTVLDLAISNGNQSATGSSVSVLLGNGDGTFGTAVSYPVGWGPYSLEGDDLDGDGDTDLTVANANDRSISVLLGNGDGTFVTHQTYVFSGGSWGVIFEHTTADFDGDDDIDVAMIMLTPNIVVFLPNDGTGTFSAPQIVDNVPGYPVDIESADFDGDNDIDIIVEYGPQLFVGDRVRVIRNNGDATFGSPRVTFVGGNDIVRPVADFNGDDILDVAVNMTTNPGGYISVAMGSGDGSFGSVTTYSVDYPTGITTADFDDNGNIDLAVTSSSPYNSVSVMLGNGDGTFATPQPFTVPAGPICPTAADLDGDSYPDLVTANFSVDSASVLINTTCPADLNGDRVIDISDLGTMLPNYGMSGATYADGDLNGDGDVNIQDLGILLAVYGMPC
jgi:hypothetical protein